VLGLPAGHFQSFAENVGNVDRSKSGYHRHHHHERACVQELLPCAGAAVLKCLQCFDAVGWAAGNASGFVCVQPFNDPLTGTTRVSRYQKGKTSADFSEVQEQETVSGSGISWAICKSAPRSRQITTPAHHHSVFCRPDALPAAQPTASKH